MLKSQPRGSNSNLLNFTLQAKTPASRLKSQAPGTDISEYASIGAKQRSLALLRLLSLSLLYPIVDLEAIGNADYWTLI